MMNPEYTSDRLSRTFHSTFKPERQYISSILKFAASGMGGDDLEISSATGIPTGASTVKVPAIIDYCKAMGLLVISQSIVNKRERKLSLTPFGRIVLLEDPFLKYKATQWISHLNLCNPTTGADTWYYTFVEDALVLGRSFSRDTLDKSIKLHFGIIKGNVIGPMVGMYDDEASFKLCGALSESHKIITKATAPITDEMARGYGAWIIQMMTKNFPERKQISITDFEKSTGLSAITGWSLGGLATMLEMIERKSILRVDRHMDPWLIQSNATVESAWQSIYMDLI